MSTQQQAVPDYNLNASWHDVVSSNLQSVAYDEEKSLLYVRFLNGGVYYYENVPKELYDQLLGAESAGKYLNAFIKPHYAFKKLS